MADNGKLDETLALILSGGLITALGGAILKLWQMSREGRKQNREDERVDYDKVMADLRGIITQKDEEIKELKSEYKAERKTMINENIQLRRSYQRAMIDLEGIRARLSLTTQENQQLRQGIDPILANADRFDPVIFADENGTIHWVNESAVYFFQRPPDTMIGSDVIILISPQMRKNHQEGMKRLRERRKVPGAIVDRMVSGRAVLSDGTEVPVNVILSAFLMYDHWVCRAQFQRRFDRIDDSESDQYPSVSASASGTIKAITDADMKEGSRSDAP